MATRFSRLAGAFQRRVRPPPIISTTVYTVQILAAFHLFTTYVADIQQCEGFSMLPTLLHSGEWVLTSPIPYMRLWSSSGSGSGAGAGSGPGSGRTAHPVQRGDLVFATSPRDPRVNVCKRVIGLEGDVVEVDPRRAGHIAQWAEGSGGGSEKERREEVDEVISTPRDDVSRWIRVMDGPPRQHTSTNAGTTTTTAARDSKREGQGDIQEFRSRDAISRMDDEDHPLPDAPLNRPFRGEGQFVKVPKGHVWVAGDNMSNSTDSRSYGPLPIATIKAKVLARVRPSPKWLTDGTREITLPQ